MKVPPLIRITLLTCIVMRVPCQIFSLPHKMAVLFYIEEDLLLFLLHANHHLVSRDDQVQVQAYIASCHTRLAEVPSLDRKEQVDKEDHLERILERLVGNPVHLYCLVERMVTQLPSIRKKLSEQPKTANIAEGIGKLLEKVDMVMEQDLVGVTQALARIQFAYRWDMQCVTMITLNHQICRLDPVDLASGVLMTVSTSARLTAAQMLSIAHSCYSGKNPIRPGISKEYALAIEWAEGAQKIAKKGDQSGRFVRELWEFLNRARIVHDRNWKSPVGQRGVLPNEEVFVSKIFRDDGTTKSGKQLREEEKLFLQTEPQVRVLTSGFNIHDFYALCRGESLNMTKHPKNPKCYTTTQDDPYFLLAPLKLEMLSDDPPIYMYHHILTEGEIHFMTSSVMAQLKVLSKGHPNKTTVVECVFFKLLQNTPGLTRTILNLC